MKLGTKEEEIEKGDYEVSTRKDRLSWVILKIPSIDSHFKGGTKNMV